MCRLFIASYHLPNRGSLVDDNYVCYCQKSIRFTRTSSQYFGSRSLPFSSIIEVEDPSTSRKVDAKSIMQLLMMAAGQGSELILHIAGDDQVEATETLKALFEDGFGEPCR